MVDGPRACMTAEAIGREADFFSFGTNDLTQATFAFSRDDVEGKFLLKSINEFVPPIMVDNPFEHLDVEGVVQLISICVEEDRKGHLPRLYTIEHV